MTVQIVQIVMRQDTTSNWTSVNPVMAAGEQGYDTVLKQFKVGDGVTSWTGLPFFNSTVIYTVTASLGSPRSITAAGGITPVGSSREMQFIQGSGGPVTVTASPPIAAGTVVGQELLLRACSDSNTVTLNNAMGLSLNGPIVMGLTGTGALLSLVWDGTQWCEVSRR